MVTWTEQAKADLRHIFEFIADDSRHYARKVVQDIIVKTDILHNVPRAGKQVSEIGNEAVRELALYSYRILYEIRDDDIYVLAVVHKRRDFKGEEIDNR